MENKNNLKDIYLRDESVVSEESIAADNNSFDTIEKNYSVDTDSKKPITRVSELIAQRGKNKKVYKMSDGSEQAVFYPENVHVLNENNGIFEAIENNLTIEVDRRHFVNNKNNFIARFSNESENDELFSIEKGMHRVTVFAKKNKKMMNKGVLPKIHKKANEESKITDVVLYENVENGTDYKYSVHGAGIKENIVVKEKSSVYRYGFIIHQENVVSQINEANNRISFISAETGEEIFYIPTPFMTDLKGTVSTSLTYELRSLNNNDSILTIIADSEWINSEERLLPVKIDPQIMVSTEVSMTTYSWENGYLYNSSLHSIGGTNDGCGNCAIKRMYIDLNIPNLPSNARIKKAELKFYQASNDNISECQPKIGIYHLNDEIHTGDCTPLRDSNLIDYAVAKIGYCDECNVVSYSFDITAFIDPISQGEMNHPRLVMQMIDENANYNNALTLYGSSYSGSYVPQLVVTYESSYAFNSSHRTHTHELGRFGQGSIDLKCGNLFFESEDFSWLGNRMPVTIKHLYNSALSSHQYTQNSSILPNIADFSEMKLGYGFKLNIMQSMVFKTFQYDGQEYLGYVFTDEHGYEEFFKKSEKYDYLDGGGSCYYLYENVNDPDMLYHPGNNTLTQGDEKLKFDSRGRLIKITDVNYNNITINYSGERISSATDGAGRDFGFGYNSNGFLTSITAPNGESITYAYTDNYLSAVTYEDGKKARITYSSGKPISVTLLDTCENNVYKVEYDFTEDKLTSIIEYGVDRGVYIEGAHTIYSYSAASNRTIAQTIEQADFEEGEFSDNIIKTVYTFDDECNVISEYMYSEDTGNTSVEGEGSGINPFSGNTGTGVVSNINNLARNHSFEDLSHWSSMDNNGESVSIDNYANVNFAKYGKNVLRIITDNPTCSQCGVYQTTGILPKGTYTYSAYISVNNLSVDNGLSAYIRVVSQNNTILAVSEGIRNSDSKFVRLTASFELENAQSVKIQILVDGKGTVYVDAVQLENNPYANSYNMLENGNFEGDYGWTYGSGVYYNNETIFNMNRSLMINGDLDSVRCAHQEVSVKTARSTRETFTLSGWAKGYALPVHERDNAPTPTFRLRAVVSYFDKAYNEYGSETFTADFLPCTEEWQFASIQFAKGKYRTINNVRVYCDYGYNTGTAYFDDIQLVRNNLETGLSASDFVVGSTGESEDKTETTDTTPTLS